MTAGCSAAFRTTVELLGSGPLAEFQPSATDYLRLRRITVCALALAANDTLVLGLGTPAAAGTGRAAAAKLLQEDAGDSQTLPSLNAFVDWTIPPTIPTSFFRRATTQVTSTLGNIVAFDFASGLGLAAGGSLVLWAISEASGGSAFFEISVEFDG